MAVIRLAEVDINTDAARLLGFENAMRYTALPIGFDDVSSEHLRVAMCEPFDTDTLAHLTDITEHFIVPVSVEEEDLRFYINKIFGEEEIDSIASRFLLDEVLKNHGQGAEISEEIMAEISSAPAVQFIDSMLEAGVINRASDIHIEPFGKFLRARHRVDGVLVTYSTVDISLLPNVISRLKIIAGLDIAEKRLPQDGHFSSDGVDFRLSTLPTAYGEKAVIRILQKIRLKKSELGFFEDDLTRLTELFSRPYGAIFMTGPTGSGKSTTLNCFLEELDSEALNIVTVEDPVENPITGVSHVNVDKHTLTFAGALRHILRQDPDIIMIGEIRDEETARIAIQAAITGHVVLSTLHTNDAAGVIERLSDMGIETYLAAAALNGIISQRLVRKICQECTAPTTLTPRQAQILQLPLDTPIRKGKGCVHCNQTGYSARFAVYEYVIFTEKMRREITENPISFATNLRERGALKTNAIRALKAGHTTAEEIIRALNRDAVEE
ncbi:MAG: GspE/PulE family protein [Defluviitaleaceae bacterium]|nr:GspE/PulE family protein [Defluviitaleaceae bacterium]